MGPPGSVELPLAAYRAATLRSVGGVVTSRGIEPRSLGLQPSAMTTPARWSLGWSRRRESNPRLRVTRAPCCRQHFVDVVQARGFEPRFSGNRPDVLPVGRSLVGPAGWSRTSLVPLKRRVHVRSATTGYDEMKVGCRAGIRTRIFPVNSRTCCRCHHPTNGRVGRTRTSTRLRPRQVGCRLPYDPKNELG